MKYRIASVVSLNIRQSVANNRKNCRGRKEKLSEENMVTKRAFLTGIKSEVPNLWETKFSFCLIFPGFKNTRLSLYYGKNQGNFFSLPYWK